ncbi:DegT/DnrJ/EryC1/StrS aminotransferase family protein [Candidatus Pelagibacter bacterium]|nr:DegT/DnrJ/EryC1/StrS aminotransferase family protein [Candidatus Pelagibacter bacterium]
MNEIKFNKTNISDADINVVSKIIKSGWLTHGKYTHEFEKKFKKFTKSKYAISVSSCTAGLHLSCLASGFKQGDEIIVPAQTHTATAHAVEYTGAKAVFADVENLTGNISLKQIKNNLTSKTKGVIVVHMAGYPCEIDKISSFCKKKKLILLEDCAHAIGTKFKKKHAGNFGISGSFSFYPTKQITTGEGGMVVTNDKRIFEKIKKLKAFGIDKDIKDRKKQGDYDVKSLGFNYRMTDFQAALGFYQILRYNENLRKRHLIAKRYIENFKKIKKLTHMPYSKDCSFFIFQIFCKNRDYILKELKNKKIGVSVHYLHALPKMSYYKKKYNLNKSSFLNADNYGLTNISLPIYPKLKYSEVDKICKTIINLIK